MTTLVIITLFSERNMILLEHDMFFVDGFCVFLKKLRTCWESALNIPIGHHGLKYWHWIWIQGIFMLEIVVRWNNIVMSQDVQYKDIFHDFHDSELVA